MKSSKLAPKEEEQLYLLSSIPAVVISLVGACYYAFVHLEELNPQESIMWDALSHLLLYVFIGAPLATVLTFELLYQRKMRDPPNIYIRRLLRNTALVLIMASLFFASYVISFFFVAPFISEKFASLLSFFIWALALYVVLARNRHIGRFLRSERG